MGITRSLLNAVGGLATLAAVVVYAGGTSPPPVAEPSLEESRPASKRVALRTDERTQSPPPAPLPRSTPFNLEQSPPPAPLPRSTPFNLPPDEVDYSRQPDYSQSSEQRYRPYLKPPIPKCSITRAEALTAFSNEVKQYRSLVGDVTEKNLKGIFGTRYESIRRVGMGESNEELPKDYEDAYRAYILSRRSPCAQGVCPAP